jgi:hypothetical protein
MKDNNNPTKTYNTPKQIQKNPFYFNSFFEMYENYDDNFAMYNTLEENFERVPNSKISPVVREGPKYHCVKEEIFQTVFQLRLRRVGDQLHDRSISF